MSAAKRTICDLLVLACPGWVRPLEKVSCSQRGVTHSERRHRFAPRSKERKNTLTADNGSSSIGSEIGVCVYATDLLRKALIELSFGLLAWFICTQKLLDKC